MKTRLFCITLLGAIVFASGSSLGQAVNFSENWDSYYGYNNEPGLPPWDPAFLAAWPVIPIPGVDWFPVDNHNKALTKPNSLFVNNSGFQKDESPVRGIRSEPTLGGNLVPGAQVIVATDDDPLTLDYWFSGISGTGSKQTDAIVEVSMDDTYAPRDPAGSSEIIPTLAWNACAYSIHQADKKRNTYFDGQDWYILALGTPNGFQRYSMEIRSTDVTVCSGGNCYTLPRLYTGPFNKVSVHGKPNTGTGALLDILRLKGGVIEWIPLVGALDILPDDCPNMLVPNPIGKGRIPMTLFGTADVDVAQIDPDTVRIAGIGDPPAPDAFPVTAPKVVGGNSGPGAEVCDCGVPGDDGYPDMNLKFSRRELIDALHLLDAQPGDVVEVTVEANLYNGRPVSATDCITIMAP